MPCFLPPHHFAFRAQMETPKQGCPKDDKDEICGLYLNLKDLPADEFLLMKFSVNVICECKQEQENLWKHALVSKGLTQSHITKKKFLKHHICMWHVSIILLDCFLYLTFVDHFIDCGNQPMTIVSSSCPVLLSKHKHDYSEYGLQQEYFLHIMVFDFSKASVVPLEAQRIFAKQKCSLQLRNHLFEWMKPYDVTIKCKGGYSIGAHKNILSSEFSKFIFI